MHNKGKVFLPHQFMTQFKPHAPYGNQPLSPRLTMPTMYDLPSEDPEDPGLPDEFHDLQPQLLSRTLHLVDYAAEERFTGTDLNLYYDSRHLSWYKRPDWFLALGVSRLYDGEDLRASYVMWQEGVSPSIVIELLSPGTEKEDLGENSAAELEPLAETSRLPMRTMAKTPPLASGMFMRRFCESLTISSLAVIPIVSDFSS
jgi:hypothetical protein